MVESKKMYKEAGIAGAENRKRREAGKKKASDKRLEALEKARRVRMANMKRKK